MNRMYTGPSSTGTRPARPACRGWSSGRLVFGLLLLTLGVLWTLDNLRVMDAGEIIRWWPALLVLWGLGRLSGLIGERRPVSGAFWTLFGGALLLRSQGLISFGIGDLWPLVLIFIGAAIIHRSVRGRASSGGDIHDQPLVNALAVMGGIERKVVAEAFRGGDVSAIMGGADIDLRSARLDAGGASLDVFALFGGIDIIVPEGWRVVSEVTPFFGGFEDSTVMPSDPNAPSLVVRGMAIMGGIDVKHARDRNGPGSRRHAGGGVRAEVRMGRDRSSADRGPEGESKG